jgi:hypothetical protein
MRPATDIPAGLAEIAAGRLTLAAYLRSLQLPLVLAVFAWDDPLPALLQAPFAASVRCRLLLRGRIDAQRRSRR